MSDRTKVILISAAVVAGIYVASEFLVKPKVSGAFGVPVR